MAGHSEQFLSDPCILADYRGLIQLVAEIEKELAIAIRTEDLTSRNFGMIKYIATLVSQYIDEKE